MPNCVLVMSDEHNPFVSSPHGHAVVRTPNMQRLADEGVVFENAYCPSPLCMPSRTAFMTGRRVHAVQAYSNCNVNVSPEFPTYGQALTDQGVHVVHIGKLDVHAPWRRLGFSEVYAPLERDLPGDVNHCRQPLRIRKGAAGRANGFGPADNPFERDLCAMEHALDWLRNRAPQLAQPWVLVVNLIKPHFPHHVTPDLWEMYAHAGDAPMHGPECASARHPYACDLRAHFETEHFTDEQVRGLRRGYLGCVTFIDRQLGRILDALGDSGRMDDTNVVYASDHGDMLGKFGLWWKCSLYEDSARVPCFAMGPDFRGGRRVQTPVDLLDVQAELFRATGAQRPGDWVGRALYDIPHNDPNRAVFSEYHGHGTRAGSYMIRKAEWKLIYHTGAEHQLFNLAEDPDELENRIATAPEKALELEWELREVCFPEEEDRRATAFREGQFEAIASNPRYRARLEAVEAH